MLLWRFWNIAIGVIICSVLKTLLNVFFYIIYENVFPIKAIQHVFIKAPIY